MTSANPTTKSMVSIYRKRGFKVTTRYDATFRGTFVTVRKGNKQVLGAFASRKTRKVTQLSLPRVRTCDA